MQKIAVLVVLICLFTAFILIGCESSPVEVNVDNSEELNDTEFGKSALISIGNCLYYDKSTGIVYWWNGHLGWQDCATTPTPYYAPNGLPYKYEPETNTFVEIS